MTIQAVGLLVRCCALLSLEVERMPVRVIQVRKYFMQSLVSLKFQCPDYFTGGPLVRTSGDGVTAGQNYELIGKCQ